MAASHDPEIFFRKPFWLTAKPVRFGKAPDTIDALICVWRAKSVEPTVKWSSVVIKKYYYRPMCLVERCVSRTGKSPVVTIREDRGIAEVLAASGQKRVIMVDNYYQFIVAVNLS
jgi:hypothetical protein